jgi:hypothetical protein
MINPADKFDGMQGAYIQLIKSLKLTFFALALQSLKHAIGKGSSVFLQVQFKVQSSKALFSSRHLASQPFTLS